jgi:hypothetical protein
MPELTLENLAARIEALERLLAGRNADGQLIRKKDWRRVVGMFDNDPGFADVIAEGKAFREAEREAARRGESV